MQANLNHCASGIKAVFNELLDSIAGTLDDLSGGYLVHHIGWERLDTGRLFCR